MEIKKTPAINRENVEQKTEPETPPKKSFRDVMHAKKGKQKHPSEPKKDLEHSPFPPPFDVLPNHETQEEEQEKHSLNPQSVISEPFSSLSTAESVSLNSVSELSPDMVQLVEDMANFIVTTSQNGVTTTTVIVKMDGSPIGGVEIVLDHYDTAPHSFNLQLRSSPKGAELLGANLTALQTSLQTHPSLQTFQVHILPPILSEKGEPVFIEKEKKEKMSGLRVGMKKKTSF